MNGRFKVVGDCIKRLYQLLRQLHGTCRHLQSCYLARLKQSRTLVPDRPEGVKHLERGIAGSSLYFHFRTTAVFWPVKLVAQRFFIVCHAKKMKAGSQPSSSCLASVLNLSATEVRAVCMQ